MKQIITSLDIGSNAIKLIVAEMYNNNLNVLAVSLVKSKGVKKGLIVNPELALESITEAFNRCEEVLETKIKNVIVCIPAYYAEFELCEGYTSITREDGLIIGEDIVRALQASVYNKVSSNKELISIMPLEYIINDSEIVKDPKGLEATKLTIKSVISLTPKKNVYGIVSLLDSLGIKVSDICFNSVGDYHEFRTDDMIDKQVAIVNIGDEKTEVSIMNNEALVAMEVLEIGGKEIDREIMYHYGLDRKTASFLKEKFASSSKTFADTNEMEEAIDRNGNKIKINQYEISEIVNTKFKEILEISKKQINLLTKKENSYIIVTGGVVELRDSTEVIESIFGKSVIVGEVTELGVRNNIYSSALGIIKYYYRKLSFRNKSASTMTQEEENILFNNKKRNTNNTILGKVFGYFFDN